MRTYFVNGDSLPSAFLSEVRRDSLLGRVTNSGVVSGTYISFHGLVMVDKQVRILPLTVVFPCNDSELHDRMPLYAAFGAACHLLARIREDAASLVASPSPPPAILGSCRRHPSVCSLSRISSDNRQTGRRLDFQITETFTTGLQGKRYMYLATTTANRANPQVILVKFSRKYSTELHLFCVSIGHAPNLLAFERLPGG